MLRVLIVAGAEELGLAPKEFEILTDFEIVAIMPASEFTAGMQQEYNADIVAMDKAAINYFNQVKLKLEARKHVLSKTHQGIQVLDIENIYYFQAEHKYVTAYHNQGQLLIEDSLDRLEKDFTKSFFRIHRKTLIAINQIEQLLKDPSGQYKIKLRQVSEPLPVSRRKLSQVRKLLK